MGAFSETHGLQILPSSTRRAGRASSCPRPRLIGTHMATLVFQAASTPTRLISSRRGSHNRRFPDAEQFLQQFHATSPILRHSHHNNYRICVRCARGKIDSVTIAIHRKNQYCRSRYHHNGPLPVDITKSNSCRRNCHVDNSVRSEIKDIRAERLRNILLIIIITSVISMC